VKLVHTSFVRDYLRSAQGRERLISNAKWAVNQASINQQDVLSTSIPLPPYEEQAVIASEIERLLSNVQGAEFQVEVCFKRAARLRQSILKRAFEGRLVPQDPTDEPADKLLERIRAANLSNRSSRLTRRQKTPEPNQSAE
jgi:type I restriction enzyme S subunit